MHCKRLPAAVRSLLIGFAIGYLANAIQCRKQMSLRKVRARWVNRQFVRALYQSALRKDEHA